MNYYIVDYCVSLGITFPCVSYIYERVFIFKVVNLEDLELDIIRVNTLG